MHSVNSGEEAKKIVELCLDEGADIEIDDIYGQNFMKKARAQKYYDLINLVKSMKNKNTFFMLGINKER